MKCTKCGSENIKKAKFCAKCGASLAAPGACPKCGHVNKPGAKFCQECGQALEGGGAIAEQAGPAQAAGQAQAGAPNQVVVEVQEKKKKKFNPLLLLAGLLLLLVLCCLLTVVDVIKPPDFVAGFIDNTIKPLLPDVFIELPGHVDPPPADCKDFVAGAQKIEVVPDFNCSNCVNVTISAPGDFAYWGNLELSYQWQPGGAGTPLTACIDGNYKTTCTIYLDNQAAAVQSQQELLIRLEHENCEVAFYVQKPAEPVVHEPSVSEPSQSCPSNSELNGYIIQWIKGNITIGVENPSGWPTDDVFENGFDVEVKDAKGKDWTTVECSSSTSEPNLLECSGPAVIKNGTATMSFSYSVDGTLCTVSDFEFKIQEKIPCDQRDVNFPYYCAGVCKRSPCGTTSSGCSSGQTQCSCGCRTLNPSDVNNATCESACSH